MLKSQRNLNLPVKHFILHKTDKLNGSSYCESEQKELC